MDLDLSRVKKWDNDCYGFVMWSIDNIVNALRSLNRHTTPVTVIDIGANVGKAVDILEETVVVENAYMFEPVVILYDYMRGKYENTEKYHIFNCALSDIEESTIPFDCSSLTHHLSTTYNSDYLNLGVSKVCVTMDPTYAPCIKLSNFLKENTYIFDKNVVIKIDTENQDFHILRDLLTVLTSFKCLPVIEFEINFRATTISDEQAQDILNQYHERGYRLVNILDSIQAGKGDEILAPSL